MSTSSEVSTTSKLLSPNILTDKQHAAIQFAQHNNAAVIIAPTGVGKTIISLSTIARSKGKWIVTAPPNVIKGWQAEAQKWEHTRHLNLLLLDGSPAERLKKLTRRYDVLLISLNSLTWLLEQDHGCTNIIIDELSKAAGKQASKLKNKANDKIAKRIALTATPVSESFEKLFSMLRIIDHGKALGRNRMLYLEKYFYPTDYKRYNWKLRPGSDQHIMSSVKHLIHDVSVVKADVLPPIEQDEFEFSMPTSTRALYDAMRSDMIVGDVVAVNTAVLSSKLRQIASGFAIDEDSNTVIYDNERAKALGFVLTEQPKRKALIIYEYNRQREQIEQQLDLIGATYTSVYGGSDKDSSLDEFKNTDTQYLVAQANTLSHGCDGLQYPCNWLIFYHPLWSNDTTIQATGRIWRQGTPFERVTVTTLVCDNSVDDLVLSRLDTKAENMNLFLKHLRG